MKYRIPDSEYREKIKKMEEASKELGLSAVSAEWKMDVSLNSKIEESCSFVSQSFTNNANRLMMAAGLQIDTISYPNADMRFIDTANVRREDISAALSAFDAHSQGLAGQIDRCIVIGTSNVAEAPDLPALQALILHGTTAGRVEYQAMHFYSRDRNTTNNRFEVTQRRRMINNSGATITVNEVGLYFITIPGISIMLIRDVLPAGVSIPNAGQLEVTLIKSCPMF